MKTKIIDLLPYRGANSTTFTGRPQGEDVRSILKLNDFDKDVDPIIIEIPIGTTSFNPSFYLGLFFESIKTLGGIEQFQKKYTIKIIDSNENTYNSLLRNISEGERQAINEFNKKTGLGNL